MTSHRLLHRSTEATEGTLEGHTLVVNYLGEYLLFRHNISLMALEN